MDSQTKEYVKTILETITEIKDLEALTEINKALARQAQAITSKTVDSPNHSTESL